LANPLTAIGQIATDITGDVIQQILQHSKEKKLVRVGDIFYAEDNAKVEAIFRRLAKAVSLRYEYLIGVLLSEASKHHGETINTGICYTFMLLNK